MEKEDFCACSEDRRKGPSGTLGSGFVWGTGVHVEQPLPARQWLSRPQGFVVLGPSSPVWCAISSLAPSARLCLPTSRDGELTTSPGSLLYHLTLLTASKSFFAVQRLNTGAK